MGKDGIIQPIQFDTIYVEIKITLMQRPGIETGPPAWQASILPVNQRCK